MRFPFLDRREEFTRLQRLFRRRQRGFGVLYGRRRCGKSRLLLEALPAGRAVYYVADDRESPLQRVAVATELARLLPGFDRVTYPDWDALLTRAWEQASPGTVVAIDELPALVAVAPELPSLLQKRLDSPSARGPHLVVAGSSQRMMQGLILDRSAPLYGRATEILRIEPLPCGWISKALRTPRAHEAIDAFAVWGGIPRHWELAAEYADREAAIQALVLSPLGVLYDEPTRLLLDDLRDLTQVASILTLIGQGCHRLSEIAGRLGKPATSLSRPMGRLVELGLVRRDQPFGASPRDSKRSLYRIGDPFLRFWFRFVEPNRSRLESRQVVTVLREIRAHWAAHVAGIWEDLVRESVPRRRYFNRTWGPARSWWGPGTDRAPLEVDLVAESTDGAALLIGEVEWTPRPDPGRLHAEVRRKGKNLPFAHGRELVVGVWTSAGTGRAGHFGPDDILRALQ
ncbi:MAG: ATP-binding protein [candidate division NC10 bacterium]